MISERLKKVILKELELSDYDLQDATQAFQVPGWDSLSHSMILVAIEKEYGVRFKIAEVLCFKKLGDLQVSVDSKTMNQDPV